MRNQSVQIMDGKFVINTAVRIPVYKQVISQIEQKIISGEYAPGAQLPSMNELAAYLDVSRETIKKAYLKLRDKDRLEFTQTDTPIALHLTCSTKLMKIDRIVHDLACLCSSKVLVP